MIKVLGSRLKFQKNGNDYTTYLQKTLRSGNFHHQIGSKM